MATKATTETATPECSGRQYRSECGRRGAEACHLRHDPRDTTAKARGVFLSRFERMVDPDGTLRPEIRAIRAKAARKLYYTLLALRKWQGNPPTERVATRPGYVCNFCVIEQGQTRPIDASSRACTRHAQEWRIASLLWLTKHGGFSLQHRA